MPKPTLNYYNLLLYLAKPLKYTDMRLISYILASFLSISVCLAQNGGQSFRIGKPEASLFQMEKYAKDSTAPAVIINDEFYVYYRISSSADIWQYTTVNRRIKVLSDEGVKYADVAIHLYHPGSHTEAIDDLDACALNWENGKMVKSPLKKNLIFKEKVDNDITVTKFTIPNVKTGTVIDYTYTIRSSRLTDIPTHIFQYDIPVANAIAQYKVPDYLIFNVDLTNNIGIVVTKETSSESYQLGYQMGNTRATMHENVITATAKNIPRVEKEPYVWNYRNYINKISLELYATQFPGDFYRKITSDWEAVNDVLEHSKFTDHMWMSNPLKDETSAAISGAATDEEKIRAILKLLHSKIKWNEDYSLVSDSPKGALAKGSGNSAHINFLLNSMLKTAGFETQFLLMNPQPFTKMIKPTLDNINHFVLQVKLSNGSLCYVDGTSIYGDINILPPEIMVDRAHLYGDNSFNYIDLSKLTKNNFRKTITGEITPGGEMELTVKETYKNMEAFSENTTMTKFTNEDEYLEKLEDMLQSEITDYTFSQSNTLVERSYKYKKTPEGTSGYIYMNALFTPLLEENPFQATVRKFPIEFKFATTKQIAYSLQLPEGYTIEELPASIYAQAGKGGMNARFTINFRDNMLTGSLTYTMDRLAYSSTEYAEIKRFFEVLVELSQKQIIIKRK